jgi:nucleolar protein 9
MPKENKKRGRRMDGKKRKYEEGDEDPSLEESSKRIKPDVEANGDNAQFHGGDESLEGAYPADRPFFGMLDDDEQEYFKHADELLELNQFDDSESRQLFLENVWREADGKILKIANSQSCSRLMERLIQLSTPTQLSGLFQKFSGK